MNLALYDSIVLTVKCTQYRAHTSAKATDVAKLFLLNKRQVTSLKNLFILTCHHHRPIMRKSIDIASVMKKPLGETQTLRAGCSKASAKFLPHHRPPSRGVGQPKFNQLEMVTTFTYRPSLVRIDARNFELSW